jgi:ribosomal protein L10
MTKFSVVKPELIKQALRKKANGQKHIARTKIVEVAEHITDEVVTFLTVDNMNELAMAVGGTYKDGKIIF